MKKLISLLLTVLLISSVLSVGALADTAPVVAYVTDSIGTELTDGDTIATVEGQLTVVFDSAVTDAVLEGISIVATVGSFKGAVAAEIDQEDTSKVNVRFGRLEDGAQYLLSVPAASFEFSFVAEVKYLTNVDFNDYTAADALNTKLEADKMGVIYGSGTSGNYGYDGYEGYNYGTIKTYQSGAQKNNNYLSLHPANNSRTDFTKNNTLGLVVRGDVTDENGEYYLPDGNFNSKKNVVGNKVYVMDACTSVSTIGAGYGTLGTGTQRIGNGGSTLLLSAWKPFTDAGNWYEGVDTATAIPNSSEMKWPRMVLARGDDGGLVQHLYSKEQGLDTYYYVGGKYGSVTEDDTVAQLTVLAYIGAYTASTNTARDLRFRKVSCYPERLLTVIKADSYVGGDEKKLVIHMSDEIVEDSVNSDTITVSNANGAQITGIDMSVDNDARTITLNFHNGLLKGNYNIETNGLVGSNELIGYSETLSFTVDAENALEYSMESYALTDAQGTPISGNDITGIANVNISVDVLSNEGNAFTLALAIYDKHNRLVKVVTDSGTIATGDTSVSLSAATPSEINVGDGCTIEQLVWFDDGRAGAIFVEEFEALTAATAQ